MCMLLGFTADKKYKIDGMLRAFFSNGAFHPHGWGLALYDDGRGPFIAKEPLPATRSVYLDALLKSGVSASLAIAHVRFASKGNVSIANTHPFVRRESGRDWVLAHNGTLLDSAFDGRLSVAGDTDSERILAEITDRMMGKKKDKIKAIESALRDMSPYGMLNLLFTDGEALYVYCNREGTLKFAEARENAVVFATEPVRLKSNPILIEWQPVPPRTLLVYRDGRLIYKGGQFADRIAQVRLFPKWYEMEDWRQGNLMFDKKGVDDYAFM